MKTKLVEENWKQKSDGWKSNEIDAHLSFGWKAMDNESPVPMSFVLTMLGYTLDNLFNGLTCAMHRC
jgi:hypothetical protein